MDGLNFFDYTDTDSVCCISRAVRNNDAALLQKILIARKRKRKSQRSSLMTDNRGWTAIHVAASRPEHNECLELLLRFGQCILIDPNAASFDGKTALFVACEEDCEENALSLLKRGSNVNAKTLDGSSPLHVASSNGNITLVRLMLQYEAAINDQDWQKFTPLHLAAMNGHFSVCQMLLENNADMLVHDSDGNLALHLACQRGHFGIVQLLCEKSEEIDATLVDRQNNDGMTPLMLAVQNGQNERSIDYLLQRGVSIKTQNKNGLIALQYAAAAGNGNVLCTLLNRTEQADVRVHCFQQIEYTFKNVGLFHPIVCCALNSASVICLTVLFESTALEKMTLEAPYVENDGYCTHVFSPVAYLFSVACDLDDQTLDTLLNSLLMHNVVHTDAFTRQSQLEWPLVGVNYANPCAIVFNHSQWSDVKKSGYLNALNEHDITVDYCLRCYYRTTSKFDHFVIFPGYVTVYKPVLDAVCDARVDMVDLFLSRSRIIEPDQLCLYLMIVNANTQSSVESTNKSKDVNLKNIRSMYHYLVKLKPSYYICNRYGDATPFFVENFSIAEEFAQCNLQQLCRNIIRQQLRGITLLDNLRNFHRRILDLPLPTYLKDYLLFRN